jgi:hypothetical protein
MVIIIALPAIFVVLAESDVPLPKILVALGQGDIALGHGGRMSRLRYGETFPMASRLRREVKPSMASALCAPLRSLMRHKYNTRSEHPIHATAKLGPRVSICGPWRVSFSEGRSNRRLSVGCAGSHGSSSIEPAEVLLSMSRCAAAASASA